MNKLAIILLTLFTLSSCASSYKSVHPMILNYQNKASKDGIDFSYKYGILAEQGNKKYAKREINSNIKLVAVRITNNSKQHLIFGEDLRLYSNNAPINIIDPSTIHSQLKQGTIAYLWYLLLGFAKLEIDESGEIPVGLALGPGLTVGNIAAASSANNKFKRELEAGFLNGTKIFAGETTYGLIGIYDTGYNPLSVELSNKE